jgi:hypothetical protein
LTSYDPSFLIAERVAHFTDRGMEGSQVQAVPLTAKLVGEALLLVKVPVKPMVTEPDAAIVAL